MLAEQEKLPEENLPDLLQPPLNPPDFYKNPSREREKGATWVARGLVCIFGGTLLVCLIGGFVIIGIHPPSNGEPQGKETIISEAVLPLLQGVGTFAATVFAPLLAFVLGYYFGEKKQG